MTGLGLRDRNGIELHPGDEVAIKFWDSREYKGRVHYDAANAVYLIGEHRICDIGRDRGTSLEVTNHTEGHGKPVAKRRKGKPTP